VPQASTPLACPFSSSAFEDVGVQMETFSQSETVIPPKMARQRFHCADLVTMCVGAYLLAHGRNA
jgi:hypothetical protein